MFAVYFQVINLLNTLIYLNLINLLAVFGLLDLTNSIVFFWEYIIYESKEALKHNFKEIRIIFF